MRFLQFLATVALINVSTLAFAQFPSPEEIMADNDKDKNGEITKEEATASGTPLADFFDQMDANKDGKITMAEIKAALGT